MAGLKEVYFRAKYLWSGDTVTYELGDLQARFYARSYPEFRRFQSLMGEEVVLEDLLDILRPDDVFFDIGANVGSYSCFAGKVIDSGQIVAFEPEPANAARLQDNAGLNDLDIDLRRLALSDAVGTAQLKRDGAAPGIGQHALVTDPATHTIEVVQSTADRLVASGNLPAPNVIKIDVEGAEVKVLDGLVATLARDACRTVYCEVHPDGLRSFGHGVDGPARLLETAGFTTTTLAELGDKSFIKAEKPNDQ